MSDRAAILEHADAMAANKLRAEIRSLRATIKTIEDLANHGVNYPEQSLASIYDLAKAVNEK